MTLIEASREGESNDTSRLHSAARALNIARVTRRELEVGENVIEGA